MQEVRGTGQPRKRGRPRKKPEEGLSTVKWELPTYYLSEVLEMTVEEQAELEKLPMRQRKIPRDYDYRKSFAEEAASHRQSRWLRMYLHGMDKNLIARWALLRKKSENCVDGGQKGFVKDVYDGLVELAQLECLLTQFAIVVWFFFCFFMVFALVVVVNCEDWEEAFYELATKKTAAFMGLMLLSAPLLYRDLRYGVIKKV